jgi:hypothetical protein
MSEQDIRLTITRQWALAGLDTKDDYIPICIARTESDLDPNCLGDYVDGVPTSFGLFQLHRGGLAPAEASDAELLDPNYNTSVAVRGMIAHYKDGAQAGLSGIELLKHVAFLSGWPGMLGVEWTQEHRPDYVNRLSKMYLEEMQDAAPAPAPTPEDKPEAGTPDILAPTPEGRTFTAYVSWYVSPGDTLGAISLHTQVPVDVLARFNGITDIDVIIAGTTLLIPRVYRVRGGDTLSEICANQGAGDYHFVAMVNQINPDLIYSGQAIYL